MFNQAVKITSSSELCIWNSKLVRHLIGDGVHKKDT